MCYSKVLLLSTILLVACNSSKEKNKVPENISKEIISENSKEKIKAKFRGRAKEKEKVKVKMKKYLILA